MRLSDELRVRVELRLRAATGLEGPRERAPAREGVVVRFLGLRGDARGRTYVATHAPSGETAIERWHNAVRAGLPLCLALADGTHWFTTPVQEVWTNTLGFPDEVRTVNSYYRLSWLNPHC